MIRERATELADLPHHFEPSVVRAEECHICRGTALDARHMAWERAHAETAGPSTLPREIGS